MFNPNKGPNNSDSESGYGYNENGTEKTTDDMEDSGDFFDPHEQETDHQEDYEPGKFTEKIADDEEFKEHLKYLHKLAQKDPNAAKQIVEEPSDDPLEKEA